MFNNYKKNKSKGLPKYSGGGLGMVGKDLKNTGLFLADTALAEWAPNLISQDQYSDTKYGANLGTVASVHESFDSQSPIRKNVSKMWTDDRSSGMNEEQQKAFNQVQPIAKLGSSIGEMWTAKGLGSIGQGGTDAAGNFQPSQANGFAKSLGDLSQAGTKNYTPNMYDNNSQTTVGDLSNSRRASMYPNGGIITQPNAELELDESVLHTDGTATQLNNEPSHEEGGKPMKLNPGDMIFSDKIKWNGKTAADHNKPYIRIIQKATKDLENSSLTKESKLSAHLNLMAATKASQAIFAKQEETKQSKIDSYTKRLGGIQKYPYGDELTTDLNAQQDPRFYNYQGSKMMVPNLKALSKDSGVSPEIGLNNYNNLLNKRTQVRDSNVNVGNQLPKFEYINDPAKGDYNTQFENYKKVNVGYFKNGGMLPKFDEGTMFGYNPKNNVDKMKMQQAFLNNQPTQSNSSWITPEMLQDNSGYIEQSSTQAPVKKSTIDYSGYNQQAYNDELARMNASVGNGDKSNWFNKNSDNLYQAGFGLAQNAGQLAYLSEQGKRYDKQQYHTYNPELLNDSAAMRDANEQTRRAEYNVRGASAGNAGTYLSNRVALNAQNIMNKDRIRQQYANANAGIKNRANEVNLANRYSVDDINAKNKGAALTNYYKTVGSVGTNVAQGMKDNRQMGMDEESIQLMSEFYNSPEAQKMFAKYKKEKGIKSKEG